MDRFLAAVAYLGGENPSFIWARGVYEKVEIAAWDLVNGELVKRWHFKSTQGYSNWEGMGGHGLSIADVDGDNKDEIIYSNCAIDDDGAQQCARGIHETAYLRHILAHDGRGTGRSKAGKSCHYEDEEIRIGLRLASCSHS